MTKMRLMINLIWESRIAKKKNSSSHN